MKLYCMAHDRTFEKTMYGKDFEYCHCCKSDKGLECGCRVVMLEEEEEKPKK